MNWPIRVFISIIISFVIYPHAQAQSVEALFDRIPSSPLTYYFHNTGHKAPFSGHLQGIQALGGDSNYIAVTANSSKFSYFFTATLSSKKEEAQLTSFNTLLSAPFRHAGGCQVSGHTLFVGIEDNEKKDASKLVAYDLKTGIMHIIVSRNGAYKRSTAGATAAIKTANSDYLIIVGDWNSDNFDCYRFKPGAACDSINTFQLPASIKKCAYQSINLLHDSIGNLYLIGTGTDKRGNRADLLQLKVTGNIIEPVFVKTRYFKCIRGCSFRYGAGVGMEKTDGMVIYATQRKLKKSNRVSVFAGYFKNLEGLTFQIVFDNYHESTSLRKV